MSEPFASMTGPERERHIQEIIDRTRYPAFVIRFGSVYESSFDEFRRQWEEMYRRETNYRSVITRFDI